MPRIELKSTPGPSQRPPFVLVLDINDAFTESQRSAIKNAATRWSRILFAGSGPVYVGRGLICGLEVDVDILEARSDDEGGVLGLSGPTLYRPGGNAPARGTLQIDIADLNNLTPQKLENVVLHEIAHLLGFGMTIWDEQGLTGGNSARRTFTGRKARAFFRDTAVPLDGEHWSEQSLGGELMTPFLNDPAPLTKLTLASLIDMGYDLNLEAGADLVPPRRPGRRGIATANATISQSLKDRLRLDFKRPKAETLPETAWVPPENLTSRPPLDFTHDRTTTVVPFRWNPKNAEPVGELASGTKLRIVDQQDPTFLHATDERGLLILIERSQAQFVR